MELILLCGKTAEKCYGSVLRTAKKKQNKTKKTCISYARSGQSDKINPKYTGLNKAELQIR